ncbi:MAG: OmpA/MotB family protein [Phycisphaerae bacterium]
MIREKMEWIGCGVNVCRRGGCLNGRAAARFGVVAFAGLMLTGCVSLDDHRRLQAAHRNVMAQKEAISSELTSLRARIDACQTDGQQCQRQLSMKDQLLASLREENDLLDESRVKALSELDRLAQQPLNKIIINEPKLPVPLDNALKQFAQAQPSSVEYDSQRGTMKWKADLLFALGSDVVKESSIESLRAFTDVLKSAEAASFEVIVAGHTDNQPIKKSATKSKHPTNWHLAAHRAIAVSDVLQRFQYTPKRIGVMGYGQHRPVASNGSQKGKSLNRRVEIYLVPAGTIATSVSSAAGNAVKYADSGQ